MEPLREDLSGPESTDETGAKLRSVLDTALDAIIMTGHNGTIESFNRAAEEMFGCSAEEVIGSNVSIFVPRPHAVRHEDYLLNQHKVERTAVQGRVRELTARRRDGSVFPVKLAISAVEVGGKRFYTSVIRDISRSWAVETELMEYRENLEQMVAERTAALENVQEALRGANANLRQLVRIDELTGIGNRRSFEERLAIEWRRQQRNGNPLSVLICDVDMFKLYNDHYGHPAGDVCLRKIAQALRDCFQRATEFPARYGGEEFAAVLGNTDLQAATDRAEVLRKKVRELSIEHEALGPGSNVTISVGVASVAPDLTIKRVELLEAADAALYRAKRHGRNRVEVAHFVGPANSSRPRFPTAAA